MDAGTVGANLLSVRDARLVSLTETMRWFRRPSNRSEQEAMTSWS